MAPSPGLYVESSNLPWASVTPVAGRPLLGRNVTSTLSAGCPFTVTVPLPFTVCDSPQPATTAAATIPQTAIQRCMIELFAYEYAGRKDNIAPTYGAP